MILTSVFVVYALVASRLDRLSITAPMVFVVAGVLLGRSVTDQLHLSLTSEPVLLIVELTLALLLFADASTVRLSEVEGDTHLPARLLFVGLPLTIALGTVVAVIFFPSAGWAAAALIATILAPTDAALGLAIFTNRSVPVRIRRALNVESGLNDGIATPFVTLFLTLVVSEERGAGSWLLGAGKEIGLALIVAVGVASRAACCSARRTGVVTRPRCQSNSRSSRWPFSRTSGRWRSGATGSSRRSSAD